MVRMESRMCSESTTGRAGPLKDSAKERRKRGGRGLAPGYPPLPVSQLVRVRPARGVMSYVWGAPGSASAPPVATKLTLG